MAKGSTGTSMGGSIIYRYPLKTSTKNCRNCMSYKHGFCKEFKISITDTTNAKVCKAFAGKHKSSKKGKSKRRT